MSWEKLNSKEYQDELMSYLDSLNEGKVTYDGIVMCMKRRNKDIDYD